MPASASRKGASASPKAVPQIGGKDVFALAEEAAKVSGIPYVVDAYREEAEAIVNA